MLIKQVSFSKNEKQKQKIENENIIKRIFTEQVSLKAYRTCEDLQWAISRSGCKSFPTTYVSDTSNKRIKLLQFFFPVDCDFVLFNFCSINETFIKIYE